MTKKPQNIILITERTEDPWLFPSKIGNSFVNRFTIDEDAACEILGNYSLSRYVELENTENMRSMRKESPEYDNIIIDTAIEKASQYEKDSTFHLMIIADHSFYNLRLNTAISLGMKNHQVKSVMVTMLQMSRQNLITKEVMESFCNRSFYKRNIVGFHTHESVFDDLDSFFTNLTNGKNREVCTLHQKISYFVPKLTEKELKLVELKDENYFKTFEDFRSLYGNVDVDETEMKLSESKSKFVNGVGKRWTWIINMNDGIPSIYPKEILNSHLSNISSS